MKNGLRTFVLFFSFVLPYLSCTKNAIQSSDKGTEGVATPASVGPIVKQRTLPSGLIALTYDDGPGPGTLALARYLYQQNISATFFVVGSDNYDPAGGYVKNSILNELIAYGQRIGSHTYNHVDLADTSSSVALYQVKANQINIDPVINNALCYFRPPWYLWKPAVSACLAADHSLDKLNGPIGDDWDTQDYAHRKSLHPDLVGQQFVNDPGNLANFKNHKGGIISMHDFNSYTVTDFALQETQVIVPFLKSLGYVFVPPTLEFSAISQLSVNNDFSDERGWTSNIGYYGSIRLGDVNGDGKADIMGRYEDGIHVALSNGKGFGPSQLWTSEFAGTSWSAPEYGTTIQCADVDGDGKSDLIIRAPDGIRVALSTGSSFQHSTLWTTSFSDAADRPSNTASQYYGSIRAADVNGDGRADIIGRRPGGIYVALSTGSGFRPAALWTTQSSDIADQGWLPQQYNTTIQVADVNGDGKADIVERGIGGIYVALSSGSAFLGASIWTTSFSDAAGWATYVGYYGTIRCGDVNGDGRADLIGRAKDGIHVLLSNGQAFMNDKLWTPNFSDSSGWKPACYSTTIQCGDFNGDKRADIIGRGTTGIVGVNAP